MLVPGDLGFSGLVLVFFLFFFFCPLISFLIQKKWRIAQAKKEEIMRLVAMAEEEAARAEFEANGVYDDFSVGGAAAAAGAEVVRPFKCAVCYCPTTTRCSRCKVVRYCSGKCQIIHWRRGHKEECHPPNINGTHLNGPGSDSDEGRLNTKPFKRAPRKSVSSKFMVSPELASGREDEEFEHLMDGKGAHIYSRYSDTSSVSFSTSTTSNESDTSSFPFSTSTTSNESLADGFTDGFSVCDSRSRSKGPQFDDVSPGVLENTIDVNDTNSLPSEFTGSVTSVNNISFPSKLKQKISACRPGANEYESTRYSGSNGLDECIFSVPSTCNSVLPQMNISMSSSANDLGDNAKSSEGVDDISLDSASLPHFPPIKPQIPKGDDVCPKSFRNRRPIQSEKMVRNGCTNGVSPSKPSKSLDTVDTDPSNDSQPQEFKGRRSLSSIASERHPCCGARRSSTSSVKPLKIDNAHTITTSLSEIASSLPNTSNGLKTSVRKAVQQFRVPKPSKHMPNGSSEISERNNYKMIFPYDLFVKLYKWGKVELRPCGLMNCGNSCYANAVLQCLAFTQPLTAYLLQGLHSKACPSKDWCFTCEFECLIQKASEGNSPLSPIGILSQLQSIGSHLGHGKEEDAHEFLRYAIDTMQSVCLKEAGVYALSPLAEETTLVGLIFGGYLRSKVKCMKCHGKSEQHERMMDLTVEIQGDIGTLEEALGKFTATEILDGENKYLCGRCKSYEKAKKKMTVLEAPNVLTIAFKRFQSGKFGKLNKSIRFPETLNLAPYMSVKSDKSHIYRLYGVVVHLDVMDAAFSGHYVCYIKNLQGKWFKIDDSTVKPVELERVLSKGAYMLLYSRCSPQPPSFIRNAMVSDGSKAKRDKSSEAIKTSNCTKDTTRARFNMAALRAGTSAFTAHKKPESYRHQMTLDGVSSFDSFNRRAHQINRAPMVDSSSDSSSLFSCSDEGSCSTESTRDSTSTDDLSEYIFGESRLGWNSPWRGSDASDVSCSSPFIRSSPSAVSHRNIPNSYGPNGYSSYNTTQMMDADGFSTRLHRDGREGLQETERAPFLYTDTSKNCRSSADHNYCSISHSSSNSETNIDQLGWGNPLDVKSGSSVRRPSWERTAQAQTFY